MNRNQGSVRAHRHRLGQATYRKAERRGAPEVPVADSFSSGIPKNSSVLALKNLCQLTHSLDSLHLLIICQVLDTLQNLKDTEAF